MGAKIKKGGKYKVGTETMDMESYDLVFNVPLDLLPPSAAQSATVGQEDPVNVEGDSVTTGEIDSLGMSLHLNIFTTLLLGAMSKPNRSALLGLGIVQIIIVNILFVNA